MKTLSVALLILLCCVLPTFAENGPEWPDLPASGTGPDAARWAWSKGISEGALDPKTGELSGKLDGSQTVTRYEAAVLFARFIMMEQQAGVKIEAKPVKMFSDVPKEFWARDHVAVLAIRGVATPLDDGTFGGMQPLTSGSLVAWTRNALGPKFSKFTALKATDANAPISRYSLLIALKDMSGVLSPP